MLDPGVEARSWDEQAELDAASYAEQLAYLVARSPFYRAKLGIDSAGEAGGLADIAELPLTEKDELRATRSAALPFGAQLCVEPEELVRIYSTSGTTGEPSYIPLTPGDLDNWVTGSARSYAASGIGPGDRVLTTYNAGPFVAGAALDAFRADRRHTRAARHRDERPPAARAGGAAPDRDRPHPVLRRVSARARRPQQARASVACSSRASREAASRGSARDSRRAGAQRVTEAMGIGDIGPSLWGECEQQDGMHLGARGFVHAELIDPARGSAVSLDDRAEGELVLTHLRQRAAPLLRFRTRDHVVVRTAPCTCGRTAPRIRCLGRTDDMLIVRGVNVFPAAVREVVGEFAPAVSGNVLVRPRSAGVKQDPPLPVSVELARDVAPDEALLGSIRDRLRGVLTVQAEVELVPFGSLQRSEYKSRLIDR